MARIGVFICHCGLNIAGTVDVQYLAETLRDCPGVAFTADYKYMCSDPGQALIRQAIAEHDLEASSSPPAPRRCTNPPSARRRRPPG